MTHAGAEYTADPGVLGRAAELSRLDGLLGAVDGTGPQVLVLVGEPGAGKSTLVDWTAERGRARGLRTLRVRGSEEEAGLGLSGIHQLLHPLLPGDTLPAPRREVLDRAFGPAGQGPAALAQLSLCVSVLALLDDAAARRPLLLLVDDAQWLDLGSVDVLGFLARRLEGRPVVLLLAAREDAVPARFDRDFPRVTVGPLSRAAAGLLLDAQPVPPRGRARSQVLQQAAGNPLALIELSRSLARGHDGTGRDGAATLPLTARLENLFAADLPELPGTTREVLLLAAAAGTGRLAELLRAAPSSDVVEALAPAERAGLVRVADGRVHFRHPLVRSAVCQAASFAERRRAHLALASALAGEPDRRAWHLAAAATGQDAEVADALAASAGRARARGGYATAAAALERAAELTPEAEPRARRLLAAARAAMLAGHPQWVGEISGRVGELTEDPRVRAEASLLGGWALGVTLRDDEALTLLFGVAEATARSAPDLAIGTLGTAAASVYNSGAPYHRSELERISALVDDPGAADSTARFWVRAVIDPHRDRAGQVRALEEAPAAGASQSLNDLTALGAAAWILDDTERAVRVLGRAVDLLRRAGSAGSNATVTHALALALFESGSWKAARDTADEAFWMATEAGAANVTVSACLLQATLSVLRGEHVAGRTRALEAVRDVDLRRSLSLQVRHRYAMGMAAFVAGDHADAYEQLRATFTRDVRPAPVHYHASLYHLGDLAAAAVRAERTDDARAVVDAVERARAADRSPRLAAVLHRATALLSDGEDAEEHFRASLADSVTDSVTGSVTDCWPFEQALTRLDFGEWLRRRRRSAEARPYLTAALECFERLDARPWADRTTAELRATGAPAATEPSPVSALTPQQFQIAELAARGLTNRDIAARLYLSPRTVGYHLHKIFPKLGIRTRAQLRDALSQDPPR
ncbi:AAA family ATPase [Streptomyces sp. NPDC012751]|uniref:AAA family ATPase n=1 Tax=Streptomyces sp. NPDC012751 TaxID=3364846 RepID=UPI003685BBE5